MATTPEQMDELIARHLAAEAAGDVDGATAVYTDDVEHDVVGWPTGVTHGLPGAREFYELLTSNIKTERTEATRTYHSDGACTIEHRWTGTVPGEFLGVAGHGRHISFRMLHVFEFRDGRISRENTWLDGNAIVAQLTAPDRAEAAS